MSALRILHAVVLSATVTFGSAAVALGQAEVPADDVANSRFQAVGEINANAVYVRSGPSEHDYATMKLDKGARVTVVGIRFEWLKIVPPEGSFCYVAKAYVERRGNGSVGRVINSPINVRVGSQLNDLKTKVQAKLEPGADVQILGEKDEYFRIKPPAGVFLYVNKNFVDLVPGTVVAEGAAPANPAQPPVAPQPPTGPIALEGGTAEQMPQGEENAGTGETGDGASAEAPAPPADDAVAAATGAFDKLETDLNAAATLSIEEQPVSDLLAGYEAVIANPALPESMRRIAEYRVENLKTRVQMRDEYLALKRSQQEMQQRQMALQAEREEIQQRIEQNRVEYFTALGTVRVSSIQRGAGTLYRLTDPGTGRTIVYLRSDDGKLGEMMGQFVGVKGNVAEDAQLGIKVIAPTSVTAVDVNRVNNGVVAQMTPPSLMPTGTASTGTD